MLYSELVHCKVLVVVSLRSVRMQYRNECIYLQEKASHAHLQFEALLLLADGAIRYNISADVKQPTNTRGGSAGNIDGY